MSAYESEGRDERQGRDRRGRRADDGSRVKLTARDLDPTQVLYEVLADHLDCTVCGAPLGRRIAVACAGVTCATWRTRCRGWRRHRLVATVRERDGGLHFGEFRRASRA